MWMIPNDCSVYAEPSDHSFFLPDVSSLRLFPFADPSLLWEELTLSSSAVHRKYHEFLGCLVAIRTSANTQSQLFCMHMCLPVVFSFLSCPAQVSRTQHLTCCPLERWWSFDSGGAHQVSVLPHKSRPAPCLVGIPPLLFYRLYCSQGWDNNLNSSWLPLSSGDFSGTEILVQFETSHLTCSSGLIWLFSNMYRIFSIKMPCFFSYMPYEIMRIF